MGYGLGVDLGTTFTAAAVRLDGHAEIARLGSRRAEIPSLVFVRPDGGVLIGEAAERRGAAEPFRLAREFKRRIGDPVPLLVGGSPYPAHALMARLLEDVLGTVTRQQEGPPTAVTVTYPANWGPYKRDLLGQAVRLADLRDVTLRSEPEAAAVRYAATERVAVGETVAVYDLGGGTFDAAVLRKTLSGFELLGEPEGIEQLGGIDFDEAVLAFVTSTLGPSVASLDPDDPSVVEALARLRRDCVEAKEALSYDTEVMVPVALPNLHTRVRLNRSEFETMITPAVLETIAALRRALRSAGDPELRSILLSGGSSRIPLVSQLLSVEFDRPVVLDPSPEHSIALGAALVTSPPAPPAPDLSLDVSPDSVEEVAVAAPSRRGRVATILSKLGGRSRPSSPAASISPVDAPEAGTAISGAAISWEAPPDGEETPPDSAAGTPLAAATPPEVSVPAVAPPSEADPGSDLAPDTPSRGVARVRPQPSTGRASVVPTPPASGRATVPLRTDPAAPTSPAGPAVASGRAPVGGSGSSPPAEAGRVTPTGRAQVGPASAPGSVTPVSAPPSSGPQMLAVPESGSGSPDPVGSLPTPGPPGSGTGGAASGASASADGATPARSGHATVGRRPFSTEPPAPPPAPPLVRPGSSAPPQTSRSMYGAPPTADLRLGPGGTPGHGATGDAGTPDPVRHGAAHAPPAAPAAVRAASATSAGSRPESAPYGATSAPPAAPGVPSAPPAVQSVPVAPPAVREPAFAPAPVGAPQVGHPPAPAGPGVPPAQSGAHHRAHVITPAPADSGRGTYRVVTVIVVLVVIAGLVAAGGGAYWFFVADTAEENTENEPRSTPIAGWVRKADLPLPLEGAAVAAYQGRLWVAGGQQQASDPKTKSNEVFVYDPASADWSVGPVLPNQISHATLVPTPAGLYLVGGWLVDGGSVQVLRLDGAGRQWVPQTPLPESRVNGVGGFTGTEIVYAGGTRPGPAAAGTVWALRQDTWVEIGALAVPRQKAMAAGNGTDALWIMGGRNIQTEEKFGTVDLISSGTATRSDRTIEPPVDSGAGVYVPDSGICVVGGQTPNGGFNDWWCWEDGLARKLPALNPQRGGLAAAVIDRTIYVVGGYGKGFSSLSRLDTLTLPPR